MQETLYQKADAGVSLSDSGRRSLSIRQRMQESFYQTADAGERHSIRQQIQNSLSVRQQMQETLNQTADAGDTL